MHRALLFTNSVLGAGIRSTLERLPDWSVRSASTQFFEEIMDLTTDTGPTVTIFDTTLLNVLQLFQLLGPDRVNQLGRVIVATLWGLDEETLFLLAMWGVSAHISVSTEPSELADILKKVTLGEYLLTSNCLRKPRVNAPRRRDAKTSAAFPLVTSEAPPLMPDPSSPDDSPLSSQEAEVLYCMAQGKCNKEIAASLGIVENSVRNHNTSIFKKLQVRNRTIAVARALQRGWISMPETLLNPHPDRLLPGGTVPPGVQERSDRVLCYS